MRHCKAHTTKGPLAWGMSCILTVGLLFSGTAYADDLTTDATQTDDLATRIEQTGAQYREAAQEVANIEADIEKTEARLNELEEKLPAQQQRTAASIKNLYLFQQSSDSLLSILLSADSLSDLISTLHYLDTIQARNSAEVLALADLKDDLTQAKARLEADRKAAITKRDEAEEALQVALSTRVELQTNVINLAQTEEVARQEAVEVAATQAADDASFTTSSGNTAPVEVPEEPSVSTEPLVENTTQEESDDWAARIDAYLEGSPLEGYGSVFAEAAATYGVDPRLSPAISCIESGRGSVCFEDHNAWGWGSSSWDSWESAIYDQVEGLAQGYDGTLSLEGAQRYCPPNYQEWYSSVAAQMDSI